VAEVEPGLVDDWILHTQTLDAYTRVSEISRTNPDGTLAFILEVLRREPLPRVLGSLAAGPLEDLLVYQGAAAIGKVEALASRDKRFRQLLAGVWRNRIAQDVWDRLQALIPES
jgi:hypothetical protein